MSEEIIKVLDDLGNRFGTAIDWSNQNIVPYLQELMTRFISFKNAQAIIWIVISLIILGLGIFVINKLIKWEKSDKFDSSTDEEIFMFLMDVSIVLMIIFIIVILFNINGLFQNIFVPELTVINYIQGKI